MLIAFEGPIAAGKTTLATLYSEYSEGALILEEFEKNEFLVDFYADKPQWSLPMQLSFALDRNAQWGRFENRQSDLLIADYSPLKDRIFARTLMSGRELRLFDRTMRAIAYRSFPVDLVVHVDATNHVLLSRIAFRGRPFERQIDSAYQDRLRAEVRPWPTRTRVEKRAPTQRPRCLFRRSSRSTSVETDRPGRVSRPGSLQ
jgi:deoxyguanosine kinase